MYFLNFSLFGQWKFVTVEYGQCYFQVLTKGFVLLGAADHGNSSDL